MPRRVRDGICRSKLLPASSLETGLSKTFVKVKQGIKIARQKKKKKKKENKTKIPTPGNEHISNAG